MIKRILRVKRAELGITQAEMAEKLNISSSLLSYFEAGSKKSQTCLKSILKSDLFSVDEKKSFLRSYIDIHNEIPVLSLSDEEFKKLSDAFVEAVFKSGLYDGD